MGPLLSNPELDIKLQMIGMGDGESGIALEKRRGKKENNGVVKFKCLLPSGRIFLVFPARLLLQSLVIA